MKLFWAISPVLFVAFCASTCLAVPTYRIEALGLTGPEFTNSNGSHYSYVRELNDAGQAFGEATLFSVETDFPTGVIAWVFNGTETLPRGLLGLVGPAYTRSDGYIHTLPQRMNSLGQVAGTSRRYDANINETLTRSDAWFFDGFTTRKLGLSADRLPPDVRSQYSLTIGINDSSFVSGISDLYDDNNKYLGRSAWLFDGSSVLDLTLRDVKHTRADGYRSSGVGKINNAGHLLGGSNRYNGSNSSLGNSAWLYHDGIRIDLGLMGTEHTRIDGYQASAGVMLNEAGYVAGQSHRFNGTDADLGMTTWLYNGVSTIDIGLVGAEHTRGGGFRYSLPKQLTEAGYVGGVSRRYNGGSRQLGWSSWIYDGVSTVEIGLNDIEHTKSDGYQNSGFKEMNEKGQAIGWAERFNGGSVDLGRSAWFYDGVTTHNIGLHGAQYIGFGGYQYNVAEQVNEAGQVSGYSRRYNGAITESGRDAWLYDPTLNQTFPITYPRDTEYDTEIGIEYLSEDGSVFGYYAAYDEWGEGIEGGKFYFSIADGFHDLGSLVEGGLAANGWRGLGPIVSVNATGQIVGRGPLISGGEMAFLLTPIVPEPSSLTLVLCSLLFTARVRVRS